MKYYFFRLLEKLNIIKYINFVTTINLNNQKIKIPVLNGLGHQHFNNHESWFKVFLQKLLPLCNTGVMDVGVNIGQTLLKVLSIDKNNPYTGFEPNPFAFSYSYRLIEENKLSNHKIFYTGLISLLFLNLHLHQLLRAGQQIDSGLDTFLNDIDVKGLSDLLFYLSTSIVPKHFFYKRCCI